MIGDSFDELQKQLEDAQRSPNSRSDSRRVDRISEGEEDQDGILMESVPQITMRPSFDQSESDDSLSEVPHRARIAAGHDSGRDQNHFVDDDSYPSPGKMTYTSSRLDSGHAALPNSSSFNTSVLHSEASTPKETHYVQPLYNYDSTSDDQLVPATQEYSIATPAPNYSIATPATALASQTMRTESARGLPQAIPSIHRPADINWTIRSSASETSQDSIGHEGARKPSPINRNDSSGSEGHDLFNDIDIKKPFDSPKLPQQRDTESKDSHEDSRKHERHFDTDASHSDASTPHSESMSEVKRSLSQLTQNARRQTSTHSSFPSHSEATAGTARLSPQHDGDVSKLSGKWDTATSPSRLLPTTSHYSGEIYDAPRVSHESLRISSSSPHTQPRDSMQRSDFSSANSLDNDHSAKLASSVSHFQHKREDAPDWGHERLHTSSGRSSDAFSPNHIDMTLNEDKSSASESSHSIPHFSGTSPDRMGARVAPPTSHFSSLSSVDIRESRMPISDHSPLSSVGRPTTPRLQVLGGGDSPARKSQHSSAGSRVTEAGEVRQDSAATSALHRPDSRHSSQSPSKRSSLGVTAPTMNLPRLSLPDDASVSIGGSPFSGRSKDRSDRPQSRRSDAPSHVSGRSRKVSRLDPFSAAHGERKVSKTQTGSSTSGVSDIGKLPPVTAAFHRYTSGQEGMTPRSDDSLPISKRSPLLGAQFSPQVTEHEEETPSESSQKGLKSPSGGSPQQGTLSKQGGGTLFPLSPRKSSARSSRNSMSDNDMFPSSPEKDAQIPSQYEINASEHENLASYLGIKNGARKESKDSRRYSTISDQSEDDKFTPTSAKLKDDRFAPSGGTPRRVPMTSSSESEEQYPQRRNEGPSLASASPLKRAPSRKSASHPSRYAISSSSDESETKRSGIDSRTPSIDNREGGSRRVAELIKITPSSDSPVGASTPPYQPNKRGSITGGSPSRNSLDVPITSPRSKRQSSYLKDDASSRHSSPHHGLPPIRKTESRQSSPRASIPQIYKLDSSRRDSRVSHSSRRDSDDASFHMMTHGYPSEGDRRGSMLSHHHHMSVGGSRLPPMGGRQKFVSEWFQDHSRVCGHWECKIPWLDALFKISIGRKARRPEILLISIRIAGVGSKLRGDRLLRQSSTANQERWKFSKLDHYQSEKQWPPNKDHIMWIHSSQAGGSDKLRDIYHHGKGEIFFFKSSFEGMWENMAKAQYLLLALCRIFDVELMPQVPITSSVSDAFNFSSATDLNKVFVSIIRSPDTELRATKPRNIASSDGGDFYFFESIGFNCLATYLLSHLSIPGYSTFDLSRHDREDEPELMSLFPSLLETETRAASTSRRNEPRSSISSNVMGGGAYGYSWNYQMPGASEDDLRTLTNVLGRKGIYYFYWDPEARVQNGADLPFVQSARGTSRIILLNFYSGRCLFFDTQGTSGKAICEAFAAFLLHLRFPASLLYLPEDRYFDFIRFRQQNADLEDTTNSSLNTENKWRLLEKIFQQWTFESQVSPWATTMQCGVDCGGGRTSRFYFSLDLYTIEKEVPRDKHKDIDSGFSSSKSSYRRDLDQKEDEDVDLVVEQYVVCQILSNLRRRSPHGFQPLLHDGTAHEIIKASFKLCDESEHAAPPSIRTMFTVFRATLWFLQSLHWINGEASRLQVNRDFGGPNSARGISGISSVFPEHGGTQDRSRVLYFFKNGLWVQSPNLTQQRQLKIQHDEGHGLKHEKQGFKLGDLDVTYAGKDKAEGTPRRKSDATTAKKKKRRASKDSAALARAKTIYFAPPLVSAYPQATPAFQVTDQAVAAQDPALKCILPPKGIPMSLDMQPTGLCYLHATSDGQALKRHSPNVEKEKTSESIVDVLARGGSIMWDAKGAPVTVDASTNHPVPVDVIAYGSQPSKELTKMQKAYIASITPKYTSGSDGQPIAFIPPQLRVPRELWTSPGWMFPGSRAALRSSLAHKMPIFPTPVYPKPYLQHFNPHPVWGYTQTPPSFVSRTEIAEGGPTDEMLKFALINNGTANLSEVPFQPLEGKFNPGCGMRYI